MRLAMLAVAILFASSCSDDSQSGTCPPCGAGLVCDEATKTCVPQTNPCDPPCGANANCSTSGSCACANGFFDCNGNLGQSGGDGCECNAACDGTQCGGVGPGCVDGCAPDEVCSDGKCIKPPVVNPGELVAELILLNQVREGDTSIIGSMGKAEAAIWDQEPLPQDKREKFQTVDGGETCTYEDGTLYPWNYDGKTWPSGLGRTAGDLTFLVATAPDKIVLEPFDLDPGWFYTHNDVPPPLKSGAVTYSDFFDTSYVPFGQTFTVDAAGGDDIGAQMLGSGVMPETFAITDPPDEKSGHKIPPQTDLTVKWTPAQKSATMEIFVTQAIAMSDPILLSCKVRDDGEAVIPAAALNNFIGTATIQLRRFTSRYHEVKGVGDKKVHVYLVGRHARLRAIFFDM